MAKITIFEGIDKIGKSEVIAKYVESLESKGEVVVQLHPANNTIELKHFPNYNEIAKTVGFIGEKTWLSLPTYGIAFNHMIRLSPDVHVIADRLHLSELAYSLYNNDDFSRGSTLIDICKGLDTIKLIVKSFEEQLESLFDDVRLIVFTKSDDSIYIDDLVNDNFPMTANKLRYANSGFIDLMHNYTTIKNRHLLSVSPDDTGYYSTSEQFNRLIEQID